MNNEYIPHISLESTNDYDRVLNCKCPHPGSDFPTVTFNKKISKSMYSCKSILKASNKAMSIFTTSIPSDNRTFKVNDK